jgi:hypothetical protein
VFGWLTSSSHVRTGTIGQYAAGSAAAETTRQAIHGNRNSSLISPTSKPAVLLQLAQAHLREHGWAATATRAAVVALEQVRDRTYMNEAHVWYELEIAGARPRVALAPGLELRRGQAKDVSLLASFDTFGPREARRRLAAGHDLWFVLDGARPLFSCSVFFGSIPDFSVPSGVLPLPAGMAAVEDSFVAVAARGLAIAPAAWTLIADALGERGLTHLARRVAVSNQPARKAGVKVGFQEVAHVRYRKIGPWSKRTVEPAGGGRAAHLVAPSAVGTGR